MNSEDRITTDENRKLEIENRQSHKPRLIAFEVTRLRARAYAMSGDYLAGDPICKFVKR
jgi:hypothetical protein